MLPSIWKKEGYPGWSLRSEFDRLFDDFLGERFPMRWGNGKEFVPATDLRETEEAYIVETEIPGMKQNEIEVKVQEDFLTISAERKQEKEDKTKGYHRSERYFGRMERQVALPTSVDASKVDAAYKDGVLTVTLPKQPGAKAKTVNVKVH